jgi:hypothetical protein
LGIFYITSGDEKPVEALITFAAICLILTLFSKLTVVVDGRFVTAFFGWDLIRRRIRLEDIEGCSRVRNSFWQGYGIKFVKGGLMFNVAGLDAVELKLKKGGVFRVGTDEPDKLILTIEQAKTGMG